LQDVNNTGPEVLPVSVFLTLHKSWDKIQPTVRTCKTESKS